MSLKALKSFVAKTVEEAKQKRIVFSTLESDYDENIGSNYFCAMRSFQRCFRKIRRYLKN
jgi:hypothetical protein